MLSIENLTYRIGGRVLLERASLSLPAGHHAGLVGRNGTGKSTLLQILAGEIPPDRGTVWRAPGTRVARLVQDVPLDTTATPGLVGHVEGLKTAADLSGDTTTTLALGDLVSGVMAGQITPEDAAARAADLATKAQ